MGLTVHGKDGQGIGYWEGDDTRVRLTPRHRAYLRISEGCNQRCAFCTIPSIRGKMRSKPLITSSVKPAPWSRMVLLNWGSLVKTPPVGAGTLVMIAAWSVFWKPLIGCWVNQAAVGGV